MKNGRISRKYSYSLLLIALGLCPLNLRAQMYFTNANNGYWASGGGSTTNSWVNQFGSATPLGNGSNLVFNTATPTSINNMASGGSYGWVLFTANVSNSQQIAASRYYFTGFTNSDGNTVRWNIRTVFSNDSLTPIIYNDGSLAMANVITNRTTKTLLFDGPGDTVVSGVIGTSTGGVTKAGLGSLTLSGANRYNGVTTNNSGTLILGNNAALWTNALVINGGVIDVTAARTMASNNVQVWNGDFAFGGANTLDMGTGAVTLGGNRTVMVSNSTMTVGGVIGDGGGNHSLTKMGAGVLTLAGANAYSGGTTIAGGTLALSGAGTLGGGNITVSSAGTLALSNSLTLGNGQSLTNRGNISGSLNIGAGALVTGSGVFGIVTNQTGGTLTPGVGGDTNYFSDLTLQAGSTNRFYVASGVTHDMSVVSNSLNSTGGRPLLGFDLTAWVPSNNVGEHVVLYQNLAINGFDGTNQVFALADWGTGESNSGQLLTNGASFWVNGGSGTSNFFTIAYDYDVGTGSVGSGTSIAITAIPEPLSVVSFLGAAGLIVARRRIRKATGRWRKWS